MAPIISAGSPGWRGPGSAGKTRWSSAAGPAEAAGPAPPPAAAGLWTRPRPRGVGALSVLPSEECAREPTLCPTRCNAMYNPTGKPPRKLRGSCGHGRSARETVDTAAARGSPGRRGHRMGRRRAARAGWSGRRRAPLAPPARVLSFCCSRRFNRDGERASAE